MFDLSRVLVNVHGERLLQSVRRRRVLVRHGRMVASES
jgi:hypothetical protein